jgi:DNA-binding response OmpR family regulator
MEALQHHRDGTNGAVNEDRLYGEMRIIGRRLERVQRLAGSLATGEAAEAWRSVGEHCGSAAAALAIATALVPEEPLVKDARAEQLSVRDLRLDTKARQVWFNAEEIPLAHQEYQLLRTLATEPFRVHTKRELLEEVWQYRGIPRTRTVDSHASRVRRKLIAGGAPPNEWVHNVWGVGYVLLRP